MQEGLMLELSPDVICGVEWVSRLCIHPFSVKKATPHLCSCSQWAKVFKVFSLSITYLPSLFMVADFNGRAIEAHVWETCFTNVHGATSHKIYFPQGPSLDMEGILHLVWVLIAYPPKSFSVGCILFLQLCLALSTIIDQVSNLSILFQRLLAFHLIKTIVQRVSYVIPLFSVIQKLPFEPIGYISFSTLIHKVIFLYLSSL